MAATKSTICDGGGSHFGARDRREHCGLQHRGCRHSAAAPVSLCRTVGPGGRDQLQKGSLRHAGGRLSALEPPHRSVPNIRAFREGHGDADRGRHTGPNVRAENSGRLFALLGTPAALGRALLESDDNSSTVAVIGHRLWERVFHRDPRIVGRKVTLSDQIYTIVGLMPPAFEFPTSDVELWVPLRLTSTQTRVQVVAAMRPRQPLAAIQSAMQIVAHQIESAKPIDKAGLEIVL